jgi:soluble lytic murein transglycosylase
MIRTFMSPTLRRALSTCFVAAAALTCTASAAEFPSQSLAQAPALRPARIVQAGLSAGQRETYTKAFAAFEAGRFAEARQMAQAGGHPLALKILRWLEFQSPRAEVGFDEIAAFIAANPDWPNQEILARRAEEALVDRGDDAPVLTWFAARPPATTDGALRYLDALSRAGDRTKVATLARTTWLSFGFGAVQEKTFLARYGELITKADHWSRLDRLLWDGRRDEAKRQVLRVDAGRRAVAEARLLLATQAPGVEGALRKVPAEYANDAGLAFDRMRWRRKRGQDDGARDIMLQPPRDLVRPEMWWTERAYLARRAIQQGRAAEAYKIARDHRNTSGTPYTEGEFLAGWISLRFVKDAKTALTHFTRIHEAARTPITRARGAYWAGRAAEAMKDGKAANDWFIRAAASATTFYGQLAMARLAVAGKPPAWPQVPAPSAAERDAFERNELTRAAVLLTDIGEPERVKYFINRLAMDAKTPAQHAMTADLALSLGRPDLAVAAAKRSAQFGGVLLPEQGYPTIPMAAGAPVETPLLLATIRQESAFEETAVSRAGARGMMQIMPATARLVARSMGMVHAQDDRLLNSEYNIRLGRSYLSNMTEEFDGSYVLALAAYNAGPGRVRQWLRDNGELGSSVDTVVDWIEMIPFEETRTYVQRVIENLQVYRWRLGANARGPNIEQDLLRHVTCSAADGVRAC